jgi:glucokinase
VRDASEHINDTVAKSQVSWGKIAGIGLGLPGQVDFKTGTLKFSPGLKIENVPFVNKFKQNFRDVEIRLDNDARCAARCELYLGLGKTVAKQRGHFVVVFIGTGVGSGIVVGGRIYYGTKSCAGEIGHTKISAVGPPCRCGATGCLETFITGPAIVRIAKERALAYTRRDRHTLLGNYGDSLTEYNIAEALKNKDEAALEVAQEVGELLGQGIANYANVLDPELVILGGGIISGFYKYLSTHIGRGFDFQALRGVRSTTIVPSEFENSGPVIGAALLFHRDETRQQKIASARITC